MATISGFQVWPTHAAGDGIERACEEATVGSSHEVVRADQFGEPHQPLSDQFGMLDDVSRVRDDARNKLAAFRELHLPQTRHSCSWRGLAISSK